MTQPGDGVDVALEALRSDARVWEAAADSLNAPLHALGPLNITGEEASIWAVDMGLDDAFNDARTALEDMIRQAAEYFREIGADLRSSADQYERDDEQGMHEIQNAYRMQGDIYGG
ncbi:type VII secretion target [Saccharopolyspora spinosa]|uniref:Excreted virulence factor EspC (Type VII ESX diderm) n=1 Tax=Saccharopolyspora spinosa TaxID=60894 RepID=A0A2N3XWF0_SACSN|nr:type VII secretion target [Saccharopolyspora spinosa]PKW14979.1 excreted virulence factor EspC (type VII ESX diderm) [Saccharopolyspora spinosa]